MSRLHFNHFALLAGCSLGCAQKDSDSAAPPPSSGSVSALTYNVHGLPSEITGDDTPGRMVAIAPRLDPWDIVGLQENFDDANHDLLTGSSSHSTNLRFGETLAGRAYGSGLAVLARADLLDHRHTHYSACNGVLDASSDCLASKGFQAVRLAFGDASIDVYNSHLEAGGGEEDRDARQVQIDELIESLQTWSAGQSVIFTADFNLRPSDPTDLPLMTQLREEADLFDACTELDCSEPDHIDQILFRSGDALQINPVQWENVSEQFQADDGTNLSDHPAISATFGWSSL